MNLPEGAQRPETPEATEPAAAGQRSKPLAAWLALLGGTLGLHRLYLHGLGDRLAWAHWPLTALGLMGVQRMGDLGQDDRLSWVLLLVLGLMLSQACGLALYYALMPDEKWDARHNGGRAVSHMGWASVLAAVAALVLGGGALISTIAFGTQKLFESQLPDPAQTTDKVAPRR